jgi:tripartite motif-containing protein 71
MRTKIGPMSMTRGRTASPRPNGRRARLLVSTVLLLLAIGAGSAFADGSPSAVGPHITQPEFERALANPEDHIGNPETDLEAGQELQHRNLDREGAEELLGEVFGKVIEDQSAVPGEEDQITKYDSDHVAVVEDPLEGQPAILESLLPLRAENEQGQNQPVDLELVPTEGDLAPENPLVEVEVPSKLSEGIDLPGSEVEIQLAEAPEERAPSTVGPSTAFYPNVAPDTDLAVSPTATGVETLTQIRSAEAPMTETFKLTLPTGAALREDGEGGAEAVKDGETILAVVHPSATDAAGNPVPVALTVGQGSITLHVEPPEDAVYPILVDPVYETWFWELNHSTEGTSDWVQASNSSLFQTTPIGHYGEPGLNIYTLAGGPISAGSQANWNYHVPRFYTDQENPAVHEMPTSYIQFMKLTDLRWWFEESGPPYPADPSLVFGLWDEYHDDWSALGVRTGQEGQLFEQSYPYVAYDSSESSGEQDTHTKTAAIILQSFEGQSHPRHLLVGQAEIQITDNDHPRFGKVGGPKQWVNNSPSSPVTYEVTDTGLGVNELGLWEPQTGGGEKEITSWKPCFGNVSHPCPRTVTQEQLPLNYEPSSMPQGEDWVKFGAQDPVHHWSQESSGWSEFKIKVDHTPPVVELSGSLTEEAKLGPHRPNYTLKATATDGATANPQSGVAKVLIELGGKVVARSEPGCATENCAIPLEWKLESDNYAAGQYTAKVTATDGVGLTTVKELPVTIEPRPPTISLSGSMTEQASLGTSRPRYILDAQATAEAGEAGSAAPTYVSSFGSSGTGQGQFSHPADVAIDQKGDVWVADKGNNRVEEFDEAGELLRTVGSSGSGNGQFSGPRALAVDPKGDAWVVDSGHGRVEEFNEKGEFMKTSGSSGTGNGQLSSAEGIAVDAKGDVWVADTYNARLEEFNEAGEFIRAVGTRGPGAGQLIEPTGIAAGPGGNIWVTDWANDKVVEFNEGGQYVREFGSAGTGKGQFERPDAIAVDSKGDLWVGDQNDDRVEEFNEQGEYLTQFGSAGTGAGQFSLSYPMGIAANSRGALWVTDTNDNRVEKWQAPVAVPIYSSSFGSAGTGNGQLAHPGDVALDSKGDLWVADDTNNRLEEFNEKGEYLKTVGSYGTGNGQFHVPKSIAFTAAGNCWVADSGNDRLEEFNEKGEFLKAVGSAGSGNGQFSGPEGIAIDAKGDIWVSDTYNYRIEEFNEKGEFIKVVAPTGLGAIEPTGITVSGGDVWATDWAHDRVVEFNEAGELLRQFGKEGSGNGQFKGPDAVAVDSSGDVWVGDQNNERVQEFNQKGEYVAQFGASGSGAGQFTLGYPMGIAVDSKGDIWVTDTGNNRMEKWVQQGNSSEISTEITIDGKRVDSASSVCGIEHCSLSREWTLNAAAYEPGPHTVTVKATDGLGNTTTKSVGVEIKRDTTPPSLETGGSLLTAPEGWVEQDDYGVAVTSKDAGSGTTSIALMIEGKEVAGTSNPCPEGACSLTLQKTIDMAPYAGGAHPAEVVVTDGAGNVARKRWTINVDPQGRISTEEAEATLEAVDGTGEVNTVGEAQAEPTIEGTGPGLGVAEVDADTQVTGTSVPTTISGESSQGVEMQILEEGFLYNSCEAEGGQTQTQEKEEGGEKEVQNCENLPESEAATGLKPIKIVPMESSGPSEQVATEGETATVAPNTDSNVTSVVRPLYDGAMQFEAIRDDTAPETYSWEVQLEPEQELKLVDEHDAEVLWQGGEHVAFHIKAEEAADAVGTTVPTHLSVSDGDVITLTVEFHSGSYVYPIVAGSGWQGGFQTYQIQMPPPEAPLGDKEEEEVYELEQLANGEAIVGLTAVGAPEEEENLTYSQKQVMELNPGQGYVALRKAFRFDICRPHLLTGDLSEVGEPKEGWGTGDGSGDDDGGDGGDERSGEARAVLLKVLRMHCRDPEYGHNYWRVTMAGRFHYVFNQRVWLNWKEWNCEKTGGSEIQYLELLHCEAFYPNGAHYPSGTRFKGPVGAIGEFRFDPDYGQFPASTRTACLTVGGWLYPNPRKGPGGFYEEPLEYQPPKYVIPGVEQCSGISAKLEESS